MSGGNAQSFLPQRFWPPASSRWATSHAGTGVESLMVACSLNNWPNGMAGALNEIILTKRTNLISRFDTLDVFSYFLYIFLTNPQSRIRLNSLPTISGSVLRSGGFRSE